MQKLLLLCALLPLSWTKPNASLINQINSQQSAWTAGINPFDDIESRLGFLGIHPDPNFKPEIKEPQATQNVIPETFDAREYWPECADIIGNIRNQGKCSSSWAFAAAEVMSDRLCIATNGKVKIQLSPEDLIDCCHYCGNQCKGGYTYYAWNYFMLTGLVSGGDYNTSTGCQPYSELNYYRITPPCNTTCQNDKYPIPYVSDKHFGDSIYYIPQNETAIQNEILSGGGPVVAAFDVYGDFKIYRDGVYIYTSGALFGRTAVKIIGWGTENGWAYWLAANSWGKDWGALGGFFKIRRGTNECGFEESIIAGQVREGGSTSPTPVTFTATVTPPTTPGSGVRVAGCGIGLVLSMMLFYLLKF
ncbi:cathepsin B-like cysteine proteinase 4 [Tribolium castaneum]|uniref:Cathepsin B n=1 Tax=Tribolium castaneum TaxID=7070 RepID=D6WVC8_TRICA|nr:PREDICTED: cathepsin B-like cysteine proteinase 4 [Tribolium castaneum]EFA09204.2 cathepsin B precursor [Tribolium castaneum]|eukprot:XP_968689.1 PREDICTED: cathepsin B-like cysteine proteinase 4 [Tribolium castaneum]